MVARIAPRRRSWNAGELSPDLAGAIDIKQYYAGALRMKGFMPVPQAGFRCMAGSWRNGPVRRQLATVTPDTTTPAAGPFTGTQVLVTWTFASAPIGGATVTLTGSAAFTARLECLVGGTWSRATSDVAFGTDARTRTLAFAPGGPATTSARIVVTCGGATTVTTGTMTLHGETGAQAAPRYWNMPVDTETGYLLAFGQNFVDIFADKTWVAMVALALPGMSRAATGIYAELATIGVFNGDTETIRIRRAGADNAWTVDTWPYEGMPDIDYGAVYAKTDDIWTITIQWASNSKIAIVVTINGQATPGIYLVDDAAPGTTVQNSTSDINDWEYFADAIASAINALPAMPGGVTGAIANPEGIGTGTGSIDIILTFGGASSGEEYQLTATITNTATTSALPSHTQIGDTEGEPLLSALRGWPARSTNVQDRQLYYGLKGQPAALLYSRSGEYFDINIDALDDNAPILDRTRSQTAERIEAVIESTFLVVFTSERIVYVSNRTLSRNQPRNNTEVSEEKIEPGTLPFELDGKIFYIAKDGNQVSSLAYSAVDENYAPNPETLLSSHLVEGLTENWKQRASSKSDSAKMWMRRGDGRLICGCVITRQEIFGLCEWLVADGGTVESLIVDHFNTVCIAADRDGALVHEWLDDALRLQEAVTVTPDLAGAVTGLPYPDDTTVWARAEGRWLGPFTVAAGAIALGDAYASAIVGRWIAPVAEDMPHVFTRGDNVISRPGRIYCVTATVENTESIAIGANGLPAVDMSLRTTADAVDAPLPPKSMKVIRDGILGGKTDTTCVITQMRPGDCRVTSIEFEEAL